VNSKKVIDMQIIIKVGRALKKQMYGA